MAKRAPSKARKSPKSDPAAREVFGHPGEPVRVAIYARVSSAGQQSIPTQIAALREYAARRGWTVALEVCEAQSGVKVRPERERILGAARRREIDAVAVWKLDRWGRSLSDLARSMEDLHALGVAFVSLNEGLDLSTPSGRAMAGMLSVFAAFERDVRAERVRAGIEQARREGRRLGRPKSAALRADEVLALAAAGRPQAAIARELGIPRTSVRRILASA